MGVTIVASEFSEETRKKLQEEADKLEKEYKYSPHAIMHHFVKQKHLTVSLNSANGKMIMNCRSALK